MPMQTRVRAPLSLPLIYHRSISKSVPCLEIGREIHVYHVLNLPPPLPHAYSNASSLPRTPANKSQNPRYVQAIDFF